MPEISASQVKSLRDRTGAGMMACRDALRETEGDEDKAIEIIQKKGLSKVAKKAGAIAGDGLVHAYIHGAGRVAAATDLGGVLSLRRERQLVLVACDPAGGAA